MLSQSRISEIYKFAIGEKFFEKRATLMSNISGEISGSIPIHSTPSQQMRQDLHLLNGRDSADQNPLPLVSWLIAAKLLLSAFPDKVQQLEDWIEECEALVGSRNMAPAGIAPDLRLPRVLVIRPGDDMLDQRQGLIRRLQGAGIPLALAAYSDDPETYLQQFSRALPTADVVIELMGVLPARTVAGFDLVGPQIAAVASEGKTLLQWRDAALLLEDIDDKPHAERVFAHSVMSTGFEDFKDLMVKRLGTYTPEPADGIIYIDAGIEDAHKARQIFNQCRRNDQAAVLRSTRPEDLSEWKAYYRTAARIAIIQEASDTPSLEAKLRRYIKEVGKTKSKDRCVIFRAPAPPRSEDDLSVHHWDFHYIYSEEGDLAPLGPFLSPNIDLT